MSRVKKGRDLMTDTQLKTKNEVEKFREYSSRLSPANMALLDSLLNTVAALVAMSKEREKVRK